MNASEKCHLPKRSLKPIVVALALTLPCAAAFTAPMDGVVKTRADQNIDQQYGRDSVYAISPEIKSTYAVIPLEKELTPEPSAKDDGTATQFDRGYYKDPDQVAVGAIDDGTATEFDRGYYKEPDQVALGASDDGTATEFDRGYYKDPGQIAVVVISPDNTAILAVAD